MLALWRPVQGQPHETRLASIHTRTLRVEQIAERRWHWSVRSCRGREVAAGDAPTVSAAEEAAENEVYACHPPVGDWVERLL